MNNRQLLEDTRTFLSYGSFFGILGGVAIAVGSKLFSSPHSVTDLALANATSVGAVNGIAMVMDKKGFFAKTSPPKLYFLEYLATLGITYSLMITFASSTTPFTSVAQDKVVGEAVTLGFLWAFTLLCEKHFNKSNEPLNTQRQTNQTMMENARIKRL